MGNAGRLFIVIAGMILVLCFSSLPLHGQGEEPVLTDFANFTYKRSTDWQARGAVLKGLTFDRSSVIEGDFSGARLVAFRFELSDVIETNFREADLRDLAAFRTRFLRCDFRGADLTGAVFVLSSLKDSVFDDSTRLPFSRETAVLLGMKHAGN